jgi:hypothetical protein
MENYYTTFLQNFAELLHLLDPETLGSELNVF